jgi:outer membrane protein TolC
LATLLDAPSATQFGRFLVPPADPLTLTADEVEERALAQRQELAVKRADLRRAGYGVDAAVAGWWPELKVMVTTEVDAGTGMRLDREDSWMAELSVSLPLDARKKRAAVRQAEASRDAAADDYRAMAAETRAMVRKAYFAVRNAMRLVELYDRTLVPQAKQALAIAETWNVDKDDNLSGLLEAQSTWLNFTLARLRAETDRQQAMARLERLVGGRLAEPPAEEGRP